MQEIEHQEKFQKSWDIWAGESDRSKGYLCTHYDHTPVRAEIECGRNLTDPVGDPFGQIGGLWETEVASALQDGEQVVQRLKDMNGELFGLPSSLVSYWYSLTPSVSDIAFDFVLNAFPGASALYNRYFSAAVGFSGQAEKFQAFLQGFIDKQLGGINHGVDWIAADTSTFITGYESTLRSLMSPSPKSFVGNYVSLSKNDVAAYLGSDLADQFYVGDTGLFTQQLGNVTLEQTASGDIKVYSGYGVFEFPNPATCVDASRFFYWNPFSSGNDPIDTGVLSGVNVLIQDKPFQLFTRFVPTYLVQQAVAGTLPFANVSSVPKENWIWYSYEIVNDEFTVSKISHNSSR